MSEASAASFQGVFTALVTPMRVSDGEVIIDEAALRRLVEAQLAGGVQGLVACGASGLLAVTPYYNRPPQEGLFQHFSSLCSLGAPIVLYNVPGRTGCDLLPETVARLVERPEIVALKEASGSVLRLQALARLCGNRLTN